MFAWVWSGDCNSLTEAQLSYNKNMWSIEHARKTKQFIVCHFLNYTLYSGEFERTGEDWIAYE